MRPAIRRIGGEPKFAHLIGSRRHPLIEARRGSTKWAPAENLVCAINYLSSN